MSSVRKVFLDGPTAGSETAYWEDEWADVDLQSERLRRVDGDPVVRLLQRYLPPPGAPVLEAGCGSGTVAAALGDLGHRVVGLDLAQVALGRARRLWPDFRGTVGDVRSMPFPDGTFGAIVSIGVLEHEESGPLPALLEHRRVLRPDGLLLITVPRISPLKAARDAWNLTLRRRDGYRSRGRWVVRRPDLSLEEADRTFHQYEFARKAWHQLLRDAGFEIVTSRAHLVGAGLGDLPFLAGRGSDPDTAPVEVDAAPMNMTAPPGTLARWKRSVTHECASGPGETLLMRSGQFAVGHMELTVARFR